MPTSFTQLVEDGELTDFSTFVLRCARGLDYCGRQQDDLSIPPHLQKPEEQYLTKIDELERELLALQHLSPLQIETMAKQDHAALLQYRREITTKRAQRRHHVQTMLMQVSNWRVPPALDSLKRFMIEQLDLSRAALGYNEPEIEDLEPMVWLERTIAKVRDDLAFYHQQAAIDARRCMENNAWIKQLYSVLDMPVPDN